MGMTKERIIFVVLLVILVTSGSYFIVKQQVKLEEICFENNCFEIEIAKKQIDKINGLMNRENLKENKGMLFDFGKDGNYSIWMKNMNFPIDIIWINSNLTVVSFVENANPCIEEECETYSSDKSAKYVLEINSGKIEEINLKIGDEATLSYQ